MVTIHYPVPYLPDLYGIVAFFMVLGVPMILWLYEKKKLALIYIVAMILLAVYSNVRYLLLWNE